ncbi:MAG TPA: hypothetical protein VF875_02900 [Anaeromyxobacter sp.]
MRRLLVLAVLAAACSRTPPAEPEAPRTHPLAQDGSTARAVTSAPDRAKIQLDLAAARGAVQIYKGEHGTFPPSLAALRLDGVSYPADLAYDPATGAVRSDTYPSY